MPRLSLEIFVVLLQFHSYRARNQPQCIHVKKHFFQDCDYQQHTNEHHFDNSNVCLNTDVCKRNFKITYVRSDWFLEKVHGQFIEMMEGCCEGCWSNTSSRKIRSIADINMDVLNESDIILPILAPRSVTQLYGFHFIPVIAAPTSYYFTLRATEVENAVKLVLACLNTWPLIVIFLMMAFISGFIIWFLEKNVNREDFPNSFHKGVLEGFWWSFVSMTAVGYGDRTLKTFPARFCAIIWILIGITIFSIFTGSLTYHITSIHSHKPTGFHGKVVAGLAGRNYDVTMVAQHGGIFQHVDYENIVMGTVKLIQKLEAHEIDGFLLSRPTYYAFMTSVRDKKQYKMYGKYVDHINQGLIDVREKRSVREPLVVGMLIKNRKSYQYFTKYFEDNWLQIQDNTAFSLNCEAHKFVKDELPHFTGGLIYYFLYSVIGVLGIIGCYGIYKEGRKWLKYSISRRDLANEKLSVTEMI